MWWAETQSNALLRWTHVTVKKTGYEKFRRIIFFVPAGEVGDWKNNFTPEQSKEMDETFKTKLAGTRLGAMIKYEKHCQ